MNLVLNVLLCDVMFEKIPDGGHPTETSLLINI